VHTVVIRYRCCCCCTAGFDTVLLPSSSNVAMKVSGVVVLLLQTAAVLLGFIPIDCMHWLRLEGAALQSSQFLCHAFHCACALLHWLMPAPYLPLQLLAAIHAAMQAYGIIIDSINQTDDAKLATPALRYACQQLLLYCVVVTVCSTT